MSSASTCGFGHRPEVTPIALPVDAAISHYESSALPWERAAFIRARVVAGDEAVGNRFLDAIEPFVWRRSVDFGVIEDVRQISVRIRDHFAQERKHRARLRPQARARRHSRGRVLRPDPADDPRRARPVGALARDARRHCGASGGGTSRAGDGAQPGRGLSAAADDRASGADGRRRARPICCRPTRPRSTMSRAFTASRMARPCSALVRPHVEAAGTLFDGLMPGERTALSNDPDMLRQELAEFGFPEPGRPRPGMSPTGARARRARCARRRRRRRSRRCCRA